MPPSEPENKSFLFVRVTRKLTVVVALLWEQGRLLICQRSLDGSKPRGNAPPTSS